MFCPIQFGTIYSQQLQKGFAFSLHKTKIVKQSPLEYDSYIYVVDEVKPSFVHPGRDELLVQTLKVDVYKPIGKGVARKLKTETSPWGFRNGANDAWNPVSILSQNGDQITFMPTD